MSTMSIFFGDGVGIRRSEVGAIVKQSLLGFVLVLVLGYTAIFLSQQVRGLDALVAAVVLGMVVRIVLARKDEVFFRFLPGIILAQSVLIPVGIMLYGKNLQINVLAAASPLVLAQVTLITAMTFVFMYFIGKLKWFGLKDRMLYLLGFGSAVCGASAIAITSPITECEPDDTAVGLVNNTIVVIICAALLGLIFKAVLPPMEFAALNGALLHQTGFVKTALANEAKEVAAFGLAVKSFRIALLILAVPIISYLVRRRVFIPWYLLVFVALGFVFSYIPMSKEFSTGLGKVYEICFTSALVSVGLNADILKVSTRMWKPLLLIFIVFLLDVGLFLLTSGLIRY